MSEWQEINTVPRDIKLLFFSKGNSKASNTQARSLQIVVDIINDRWPRGMHQFPESKYSHWMYLPTPPNGVNHE